MLCQDKSGNLFDMTKEGHVHLVNQFYSKWKGNGKQQIW
jgi:regulator of sigma D